MPGPPPKHPSQRRRRNAVPGVTHLPAEGRSGSEPPWPLSEQTPAEAPLWAQLWATPHAVAWERMGWTRTVARYCRLLLSAEEPDAAVTLLGEVRQLEDRLGLSPMSMRRLLWEVVEDEVAELRDVERTSARVRLKAVERRAVAGSD